MWLYYRAWPATRQRRATSKMHSNRVSATYWRQDVASCSKRATTAMTQAHVIRSRFQETHYFTKDIQAIRYINVQHRNISPLPINRLHILYNLLHIAVLTENRQGDNIGLSLEGFERQRTLKYRHQTSLVSTHISFNWKNGSAKTKGQIQLVKFTWYTF